MDEPRMISGPEPASASDGVVHWAPTKSLWYSGMSIAGITGAALTWSAEGVAVFLVSSALTLCGGHSLGMHRLLIHRSYSTPLALEYLLVYLGVLVGMAGPVGMMRTHDLRDWAQRQGACHDYFGHRQPLLTDAWWQLHCDIELAAPPTFCPEPRVTGDPVYRFLERTWMAQQLVPAAALWLAGGVTWVVWGVCLRVCVSLTGHWLVGHFAHRSGHRDWHVAGASVQGYNVPFCGLITMGESWHNNHHAFPGSARLGVYPGQPDPGWWVLMALERIGLVRDITRPGDLAPRPALQRLHGALAGDGQATEN